MPYKIIRNRDPRFLSNFLVGSYIVARYNTEVIIWVPPLDRQVVRMVLLFHQTGATLFYLIKTG